MFPGSCCLASLCHNDVIYIYIYIYLLWGLYIYSRSLINTLEGNSSSQRLPHGEGQLSLFACVVLFFLWKWLCWLLADQQWVACLNAVTHDDSLESSAEIPSRVLQSLRSFSRLGKGCEEQWGVWKVFSHAFPLLPVSVTRTSSSFLYFVHLWPENCGRKRRGASHTEHQKHFLSQASSNNFLFPFVLCYTYIIRGKRRPLSWYQPAWCSAWEICVRAN